MVSISRTASADTLAGVLKVGMRVLLSGCEIVEEGFGVFVCLFAYNQRDEFVFVHLSDVFLNR